MSNYTPPSIEACLDKPADVPMPDRRARGMVSSDKMMYWHDRAMAVEDARQCELAYVAKVLQACRKVSLNDVRLELNDLAAWLENRRQATDHITSKPGTESKHG